MPRIYGKILKCIKIILEMTMPQKDGFGQSSSKELEEIRKALSMGTGDPSAAAAAGDATPLRIESLEGTLTALTHMLQHMPMWKMIPKKKAYSTVEEFARQLSVGNDTDGFVNPGTTPPEDDATYDRVEHLVKYIGTTRRVHHPATLVNTVGENLISREVKNGVIWMLQKIEQSLFYGNSTTNPLQWDGLFKQIEDGSGNIIDLGGNQLTDDVIEFAANKIHKGFGTPQKLFADSAVFSTLSKNYYDRQRWKSPNSPSGSIGTPLTGMNTQAGHVGFIQDIFLASHLANFVTPPVTLTHVDAPDESEFKVDVLGTFTNSNSEFTEAGDYEYWVTVVNRWGESAPITTWGGSSTITVGVGEKVALDIYNNTGGSTVSWGYGDEFYRVYRTDSTGVAGTTKIIAELDPRQAMEWSDYNENGDGLAVYDALLCDMSADAFCFKQLSPMIKMPLAIDSPSTAWMQLLYGMPVVYTPKKFVVIKGISVDKKAYIERA